MSANVYDLLQHLLETDEAAGTGRLKRESALHPQLVFVMEKLEAALIRANKSMPGINLMRNFVRLSSVFVVSCSERVDVTLCVETSDGSRRSARLESDRGAASRRRGRGEERQEGEGEGREAQEGRRARRRRRRGRG